MEDLRQIIELRADPVADLLQLLTPMTGRIDGPPDPVVVVARRLVNNLLQGRELLDAEFLETDRIDFDLLGELRDVKHLLFRLADVAVNEVPVQINVVLRQDRKRITDLLLGDALVNLLQDPVVGRLDPDQNCLPPFLIDAIVKAPYGAHPTACYAFYDYDPKHLNLYRKAAEDDDLFRQYLDEWVYGVSTHDEYIERVGTASLLKIKANPIVGYAQGLDRR